MKLAIYGILLSAEPSKEGTDSFLDFIDLETRDKFRCTLKDAMVTNAIDMLPRQYILDGFSIRMSKNGSYNVCRNIVVNETTPPAVPPPPSSRNGRNQPEKAEA